MSNIHFWIKNSCYCLFLKSDLVGNEIKVIKIKYITDHKDIIMCVS